MNSRGAQWPIKMLLSACFLIVCMCAALSFGQNCDTPPFENALHSVGDNPTGLCEGDFDGDGDLDLVVANRYSDDVSILLNRGDGLYAPQMRFSVGDEPVSTAVADMNGDGNLDILVANNRSDEIIQLTGQGDGVFILETVMKFINNPLSIAAGDMNSDGLPDLLVAKRARIEVYLNAGDGSFVKGMRLSTSLQIKSVELRDINNDGVLDLIQLTTDVGVSLGVGDGTFLTASWYSTQYFAIDYALGDLNSDGHLDLATFRTNLGRYLNVFLSNGDGTFGEQQSVEIKGSPSSIEITDMNKDGKGDVLIIDSSVNYSHTKNIRTFLSNGDGTFVEGVHHYSGLGAEDSLLTDLNLDGNTDLIVLNQDMDSIGVLLGEAGGGFEQATLFESDYGPRRMALGDLDGDGDLDLAVSTTPTTGPTYAISIHINEGGGVFGEPVDYGVQSYMLDIIIRDIEGDGDLDILTTVTDRDYVTLLLNRGDGTYEFGFNYDVGDGPVGLESGDLNGDNVLDMVVVNQGNSSGSDGFGYSVFLGNGVDGFDDQIYNDIGYRNISLALGDLDGDEILDLVLGLKHDEDIGVLIGQGDGTFGPMRTYETGDTIHSVKLGDFDRDGVLDLVALYAGSRELSVQLGVGNGIFRTPTNYSIQYGDSTSQRGLAIHDINGDLFDDLVFIDNGSQQIGIVSGIGDGTFDPEIQYIRAGINPDGFAFGKLDDDNSLDMLVANQSENLISVMFNQCTICRADFLRDGDLNYFDVAAFLFAYTNQDPIADFSGDGLFDFFDISAFLTAYSQGCP